MAFFLPRGPQRQNLSLDMTIMQICVVSFTLLLTLMRKNPMKDGINVSPQRCF